jgi:hypothetical protein
MMLHHGTFMNIPLEERGAYYRGLLVLIRRDRNISDRERELMLQLGKKLDFDKRFCESAINDILKNPYIKDKPMLFSDRQTAEAFVNDAILVSLVDEEIHPREMTWIKEVAAVNKIEEEWLSLQLKEWKFKHLEPQKVLAGA